MVLLLLLLAGLFVSCANSLDVYVNSVSGVNDTSCLSGGISKPCATLSVALTAALNSKNNISFYISSGNYTLDENNLVNVFVNVTDMHFIGNFSTVILCQPEAGFFFRYSTNVSFQQITLLKCGLTVAGDFIKTSDSFDNPHDSYAQYHTALAFHYCQNIQLINLNVIYSNGLAVDITNTNGTVTIQNSIFMYSKVPSDELDYFLGGGAIAVIMNEDSKGYYISNSDYSFINCTFSNNNATDGYQMYYHHTYSTYSLNTIQSNGGGLSIQLHNHTQNNKFSIESCNFESNSALFGGGLMVQFIDQSYSNRIQVKHSRFFMNKCYGSTNSPPACDGGAVRIIHNTPNVSQINTVLFDGCEFDRNSASVGGAISVAFSEVEEYIGTLLNIINCTFTSNMADHSGSALYVSSFYESVNGYLPKVLIEETLFTENRIIPVENATLGLGCVYSDRIPILFNKQNKFMYNSGSALIVSGTEMEVGPSAELCFRGNQGHSGGAISLINKSWITVQKGASILFDSNVAQVYGGAIYVMCDGYQNRLYSENCFVRYENRFVHPSNWVTNFTFFNNIASSSPNSIYTPSILSCVWPQSEKDASQEDIMNTLCWDGWNYPGSDCNEQIQTMESYYIMDQNDSYHLYVYPGNTMKIPVDFYDDKNNYLTNRSVLNAQLYGNDTSVYQYVSNGYITLYGKPNTEAQLVLETLYPRVIRIQFNVTFLPCPPGFQSAKKYDNKYVCTCSNSYKQTVRCNADSLMSYIKWGYFMTLDHRNQTLVAPWQVNMKVTFLPDLMGYISLSQNLTDLNNVMCDEIGRTGFLCGECLPNMSAPVYAFSYECVPCTSDNYYINWFYFILLSFLPTTIFFLIVVIFNISTTSGPFNAFIFFAQMLSNPVTVMRTVNQLYVVFGGEHFKLLKAILFVLIVPYGIWNLDYFQPIVEPLCLAPGMKSMHAYAFNYLTAFYPLVLILVCYVLVAMYARNYRLVVCLWKPFSCCVRFARGNWNFRASVVDAFATFLLLSYSKFCLITFYLLVPVSTFDANGTIVGEPYLFFDPSVVYFSLEHIPFFILAVCVLLFVIVPPPLILFVFPTRRFQRLLNYFNIQAMSLRMFLEPFQGCYKDGVSFGSSDCRYFSSFYFIFRILAFSSITLSYDLVLQRLIQLIIISIIILLFCWLRPYKDDYYNKLDPAIFINLMVVLSIATYNAAVPNSSIWINVLLIISVITPLIYTTVYVLKNVCGLMKLCCSSEPMEYRPRLSISVHQRESFTEVGLTDSVGSLPDRIINPGNYRPGPQVPHPQNHSSCEIAPLTRSEVHMNYSYGSTDNA